MSTARFIIGDVHQVLAGLPENSVDLVMTSPPFLALRSYLPADHPDKHLEIGSEPTPGEFIDALLDVVEALDRVLAPHGSICIELGDTYSGSGGAGGDYDADGLRDGQPKFRQGTPRWDGRPEGQVRTTTSDPVSYPAGGKDGWPEAKSLCLIPESFRWALAYGRNPFTGRETEPWRVRNVVRWCRPNPPVGALGDKMRPATSDLVIACKSRTRYFDLDSVRHPADEANKRPSVLKRESIPGRTDQIMNPLGSDGQRIIANAAGAPPLDHWWEDDVFGQDAWLISTQPYSGSHYATWPSALCVKPILAMCPQRVCTVCGEPSRRITEATPEYRAICDAVGSFKDHATDATTGRTGSNRARDMGKMTASEMVTTGWTECDCSDDRNPSMGLLGKWRPGLVLDPFAGSGTTLAVATGHGRDAIGVDLDARNADLARERVGMFLTVEHPERVA